MADKSDGRSVLADLYGSASTLLRDIQMYLVPGAVFLVLIACPTVIGKKSECPVLNGIVQDIGTKLNDIQYAWNAWANAALFMLAAYICGHLLFLIGSWIDKSTAGEKEKTYAAKKEVLNQYLKKLVTPGIPNPYDLLNPDEDPAHLYFEMKVFTDMPELHARFIERYNGLWYMRQTLAVAFGLAGIWCLQFCYYYPIFSALFFVITWLLWCSARTTKTSFYERVATAFFILQERQERERQERERQERERRERER